MGDSDTSFTESEGRSDPSAPSLRRTRMEPSEKVETTQYL